MLTFKYKTYTLYIDAERKDKNLEGLNKLGSSGWKVVQALVRTTNSVTFLMIRPNNVHVSADE